MKTRKTTFTKIIACVLTLVLFVGILPVGVFATETAVEAKWGASADSLTYSGTFAEACDAMATEGINYLQLQSDVALTAEVSINVDKAITLDLNGYTVTGNGETGAYFYVYNADLTVTDTSANADGGLSGGESFACCLALNENNSVTLERGTFSGEILMTYVGSLTVGSEAVLSTLAFRIDDVDGETGLPRLDLSAVSDLSGTQLFSYDTANADDLVLLPAGKVLSNENVAATTVVESNVYYSIVDAPASKITYSFSANGGTGTMDPISSYQQLILPANGFTAPADKIFKAWDVNGTEYAPGNIITVSGDTEIKAVWKDYVPLITLNMTESYGDTWNGAAINVYKNGTLLCTESITDSNVKFKTVEIDYDSNAEYTFFWVTGDYDSECSFEILVEGTSVYSCEDASTLSTVDAFHTIEAVVPAKITSASLRAGADLTMIYYVKINDEALLAALDQIAMEFTFGGKTVSIPAGEANEDGKYTFAFTGIAPHQMGDTLKAELKNGETVIASKESYSVKEYLQSVLTLYKDDTTGTGKALVQLATDLLTYGAASQTYQSYNTDALVTSGVENMGTPSTKAPSESDFSIDTSLSNTLSFTAVGVWFGNVNKIYVKLSSTENATLVVKKNGTEIDTCTEFVTVNGGTGYMTGAIYATGFDNLYTFELYEGETLVQTLTYSISSYVYEMQSNTEMAPLANALYRYGVSSEAYVLYTDDLINTVEELQAALEAGGIVQLGSNIIGAEGDSVINISSATTVTLDLNGYTLSIREFIWNYGTLTVIDSQGGGMLTSSYGAYIIYNTGTLTINNATVSREDGELAIGLSAGNLKVVGNSVVSNASSFLGSVYWDSNDVTIDLSEFTGESIAILAKLSNMPLSNITLPMGWKLYDSNDAEVTATVEYGTIYAKAAIASVTAPAANTLTYNGEAQALVTAGSVSGGTMVYSLTENGDFTETVPTGTNAGSYTVYYKAADGDTAESIDVTIAQKDATDATVTLGEYDSIYSGTAKEPVPTVVVDGKTLVAGTDYDVSYSNNLYVGTATATVTFKGNYSGTASKTFEIIQNPATGEFESEWVTIGG
ncbi:MAG: hypothetical protein IJW49_02590 [Clostridia bacterium]|nr:hypothetical protein [Clostridia bacterium]